MTQSSREWTKSTFGELLDFFDYKRVPVSSRERSKRQGAYPYYGASGIVDYIDGYLFDGRYLLISEDGENLNSRKTPIAFFACGKFWVNNHAHIVKAKPGVADDDFLMYWLEGNDISGYITGAAQPKLSQANLRKIELSLPCLSEQRKITAILSAYDDLIENNTRRIHVLEEMARLIYDEWFVKFHFPGHEKAKMVESELGPVPEGWEIKKATDALVINPKVTVPKDGEKPFLPMGSLADNSMLVGEPELRTGNSGSKFQNGDTLFARITPCLENGKTGYVQFLPSPGAVAFGSTEFIVLRSRTLCPEYVYLLARSAAFRDNAIKSMSGASGRQRVHEECFEKVLLAQPDSGTLDLFSSVVSPMFKSIHTLARKNSNLRQTRDLLLPKLISGAVDVEELDIKAPAENGAAVAVSV
ncbi:MAG: restriction endonuclease subunit S [Candidatus Acidiferrales bacterium]